MKNLKGILISSSLSAWFAKAVALATNLITYPIIIQHLGKETYGIWLLIAQFFQFLILTDFGISGAVSRFVAKYRGLNNTHGLLQTISSVVLILSGVGVILSGLTLAFSPFISRLFDLPPGLVDESRVVFIISGLTLATSFPLRCFQGILAGFQNYSLPQYGVSFGNLVELGLILLFAKLGMLDLIHLALISSTNVFLSQFYMIVFHPRKLRGIEIRWQLFSKSLVSGLLSVGLSSMGLTAGALAFRSGLLFGVGWFMGAGQAGIFGTMMILSNHISFLLMQIARPMTTLSSQLIAQKDEMKLSRVSFSLMQIVFAASCVLALGATFYGQDFLRLWLHKTEWSNHDYQLAGTILNILVWSLCIGVPQLTTQLILLGTGRHWKATTTFAIACAAGLGIGLLFMAGGSGEIGAAYGWFSFYAALGFFLYPKIICQLFKKTYKELFLDVYLPGLLVTGVCAPIFWAVSSWVHVTNYFYFALSSGISIALSFALLILLTDLRKHVVKFFAKA